MLQATTFRETRDSARELKFLLPVDKAHDILELARHRLEPDPNAGGPRGDEYRTTTLYFDTSDGAVYRRVGSYGRSKYRIRRYGSADAVFLERKLRTSVLLSKRRTVCTLDELTGRLSGLRQDAWPGQWFVDRLSLRALSPVCQVSYRRRALVGTGPNGPLRLTFDDDLDAQPHANFTFVPHAGAPVTAGTVIVEMKYCLDAPALFRQIVQDFCLSPAPISKYRLSIDAINRQTAAARPDVTAAAFRAPASAPLIPGATRA